MTPEELHEFAVKTLMEEYADSNMEVVRYDKKDASEPDFYFVNNGKLPNFSVGISGVKKVNVLVVYRQDLNKDISGIDTSKLVDDYRRYGIIPRVTFASAWCISEGSKGGKPAICGGNFCFEYNPVSALPDETNEEPDTVLSDTELALKYAEAWNKCDASIIEPYLDKDFHYASDRIFDVFPCRAEYLDYFRAKLQAISIRQNKPEITFGFNQRIKLTCLLFEQYSAALVLGCYNGRLKSAYMMRKPWIFHPFDPVNKVNMSHGFHWYGVMPGELLIKNHMKALVEDSKTWRKTRTQVTMGEMYEEKTTVCSFLYGESDIRVLTITAYDKSSNTDALVTFYPYCKGTPLEVHIDKVIEWDDQLEATVFCCIDDFLFAFFATDYYCNKHKYVEGQTLTIDLAALALNAQEAQRHLLLEGQEAIDWLAKRGKEPTYDENGQVEPVKLSLEQKVIFLNRDTQNPDEATFHSPVGAIEETSILGVDFFKTTIMVCNKHIAREDRDLVVSLPIYFRREFFPDVKEGDPLSGWLWVTGSIAGEHEPGSDEGDVDNHLGEMAVEFEDYMDGCDFDKFDNLMFVLSHLPLLKIREGYELDAFQKGDSHGWVFQPYCCRQNSFVRYIPSEHGEYDDSMYIQNRIDYQEAETVPPYMSYFSVPFTPEGIFQAWMLNNLTDFMPRGWHAGYGSKTFIFETSRIEHIFRPDKHTDREKVREEVFALDPESLLPKVSISGNYAVLEYVYWNDWSGLVKVIAEVDKEGNTVRFGTPTEEVLVAYHSSLRF